MSLAKPSIISRIKKTWDAIPYRYKAAIARFLRVVISGGLTAAGGVVLTGLGPKAAIVLYASAFVTGAINALDVYRRQASLEGKIAELAFESTGDPEAEPA